MYGDFHSIDKAAEDKSMRGQIKNYRSDKEEITLVAEFDEELFGFFGWWTGGYKSDKKWLLK